MFIQAPIPQLKEFVGVSMQDINKHDQTLPSYHGSQHGLPVYSISNYNSPNINSNPAPAPNFHPPHMLPQSQFNEDCRRPSIPLSGIYPTHQLQNHVVDELEIEPIKPEKKRDEASAAKISYLNKNQVLEELSEENSDQAASTNFPKPPKTL